MGDVTAVGMDTVTEKSGHQVTGMAVSVCITPAAPAPLPIPYPTMGTVAEGIVDEPMRTKINGAKHATVGSCVKVCHGNEPGAMKEVVSLNTSGPSFLLLGAPTVFCELGMMGITGSLVQMNKAITVGAPGSASGAGDAGAGGGGGGDGGGSGGDASKPDGPSGGGGSGGDGTHEGAAPPAAGAPAGQEGQADAGHPVDVITGTMFTPPALDWLLPGLLEVAMLRSYRTSAVGQSVGIGRGWSHSLAWRARRNGQTLTLIDHEHRALELPLPEPGQRVLLPYGRSVERQEDAILVNLGDDLVRLLRPSVAGDPAVAERGVPTQYDLAQLRDAHGHFAELEWTHGEVSRIVDSVGRVATFHVDGLARTWTLALRDEAGEEYTRVLVSYQLDARGDLVRVVDAGGATTEYAYDDEHYMLSETQPDGLVYHFRYQVHEGQKRCVETWGQLRDGDVLAELGTRDRTDARPRGLFHARMTYGPERHSTTVVDALNQTHLYEGNALGLVTAYVDPRGSRRELVYDASGNVVRIVSADGSIQTRTHDANGLLTGLRDANGRSITLSREPGGSIASVIDPAGGCWRFEHDSGGRLVSRADPCGGVTCFEYDAHGRTTKITGPTAATETREYDAHGNLSSLTGASGATWRYAYDLFGMPVRIETPTGATYLLEFDTRGCLVRCVGPNGTIEHQYDAKGHLVATRHPSGAISRWRFIADVIVESQFPDGSRYRYGYDATKLPIWLENTAGERLSVERDAAGNIVQQISFGGVFRTFVYDACNRVVRSEVNGQQQQTYEYDRAGNLVRQESDGVPITFEYDAMGMPARARNGLVEVSFERDALGRVTRETQSLGGWAFSVEREFDGAGWTTSRRYSSGWQVRAKRDGAGRVCELETDSPDGVEVTIFEHDGTWAEVRRRCAGGQTIETGRDAMSRPVRVDVLDGAGRSIRTRLYDWAPSGPLASVADSERGRREYQLDGLGRPLKVSGLGTQESMHYSPHGVPIQDGVSVWTAGRVVETREAAFRWDAAGRLASRTSRDPLASWSLAYDGYDRLVSVLRGDGRKTQYIYDAFGRRIAETGDDGRSTWFGWDEDCAVEERSTHARPVRRVFHEDGYTPLLESGQDAGGWSAVACDAVGTPWLYLDDDGIRGEIELTAWGGVASSRGQHGSLRLAGQRADDTGLVYNRSRYYSPELGTFLTPDPLGVEASLFDIGFVPNVTLYMDPFGLVVVQMSDEPPCPDGARARALATGQRVVHYSQLGPGSLAGEPNIDVYTHGSPGYAQHGSAMVTGAQMGQTFRAAGFTGNRVHMTCCNGGTDYPGHPGTSVAQGVANQTGATTIGCVGDLMYNHPTVPGVTIAGPSGRMTPFAPQAPPPQVANTAPMAASPVANTAPMVASPGATTVRMPAQPAPTTGPTGTTSMPARR